MGEDKSQEVLCQATMQVFGRECLDELDQSIMDIATVEDGVVGRRCYAW